MAQSTKKFILGYIYFGTMIAIVPSIILTVQLLSTL
jgi:hypothetical protein